MRWMAIPMLPGSTRRGRPHLRYSLGAQHLFHAADAHPKHLFDPGIDRSGSPPDHEGNAGIVSAHENFSPADWIWCACFVSEALHAQPPLGDPVWDGNRFLA